MSSDAIIVTDRLSKCYRLGGERVQNPTLREALAGAARRTVARRRAGADGRDFWALRDLSLEIGAGDIVGIVGRNGAGKTTLLKILSRITAPTSGTARLDGRVGALLEVGTGFHPELTGRENIWLNGAILGMTRAEIRARFDEIVAFSEIADFLDTPVKRYSSGMYVRLAFAVAAHLEPEILIVDEVLAVGDAAFQRKCLAKMGEVAGEGRTILFVSHNMSVIQALCRRGILLEDGSVTADGDVHDVIARYLKALERASSRRLADREDRDPRGWRQTVLTGVDVTGAGGAAPSTGHPVRFVFEVTGATVTTTCAFTVYDHLGLAVATFDSSNSSVEDRRGESPDRLVCELEELPLLPGHYRVDVLLRGNGHIQDGLEGAVWFDVEEGTTRGRPVPMGTALGAIFPAHRWTLPDR